MITTIVTLAILSQGYDATARERQWTVLMSESPRAKAAIRKHRAQMQQALKRHILPRVSDKTKPSKEVTTSGADPYTLTAEEKERERAYNRGYGRVWYQANKDLREGRYEAAEAALTARLRAYPWENPMAIRLADVYFRQRRPVHAYRALVPFVRDSYEAPLLLRAALAAAMVGEVYPGQTEYCANHILRYNSTYREEIRTILPAGRVRETSLC